MQESSFQKRFAEACGSDEPARIQRLLGISYQAAKNYLGGRLPDTKVLMLVAENTPYSIHWLLTGEGEKLVREPERADTLISARRIRALIREEFAEAVSDILNRESGSKVVVLDSETIRSENPHQPATAERPDGRPQRR